MPYPSIYIVRVFTLVGAPSPPGDTYDSVAAKAWILSELCSVIVDSGLPVLRLAIARLLDYKSGRGIRPASGRSH